MLRDKRLITVGPISEPAHDKAQVWMYREDGIDDGPVLLMGEGARFGHRHGWHGSMEFESAAEARAWVGSQTADEALNALR